MFIHYLNDQILNLYGVENKSNEKILAQKLLDAIFYTLLYKDEELFIPTVDLIQSKPVYHMREDLKCLADSELINFIGTAVDTDSILEEKYRHFKGTGVHSLWFEKDIGNRLENFTPYFSQRMRSTTNEMKLSWNRSVKFLKDDIKNDYPSLLLENILTDNRHKIKEKELKEIKKLPNRLEDKAFLWSVIQNKKMIDKKYMCKKRSFEFILAYIWINSYLEEYGYDVVSNIPGVGQIDCGMRNNSVVKLIDLKKIKKILNWIGLTPRKLSECTTTELIQLITSYEYQIVRNDVVVPLYEGSIRTEIINYATDNSARTEKLTCLDIIKNIVNYTYNTSNQHLLDLGGSLLSSQDLSIRSKNMENEVKRIFIGHGRSKLWLELKDFVEKRLELPWDEFNRTPVAGKGITERLEEMLAIAGFAFIILTAEDEHADGSMHPRENATHELGLFQGKLGVDKAIILLEEGCEEFSNIKGLNQLRFPKGNIKAISEDIRMLLEERFV